MENIKNSTSHSKENFSNCLSDAFEEADKNLFEKAEIEILKNSNEEASQMIKYALRNFFFNLVMLMMPFMLQTSFAQQEANIWHFGDSVCLDFSSGEPVQVPGSSLWSSEGSTSYCDAAGNLLFYTNGGGREPLLSLQDGGHIWNSNNAVMYDMQGVEGGGFSSKQSAVAFEAPGQAGIYYLFTMDEQEFDVGASPAINAAQPNGRGLRYFKIDMAQNSGLGAVITANQPVYQPSAEGLCAIKHANGIDYWVLINQDSTGIGVYSITSAGVSLAGVYNFPFLLRGLQAIKASPKGDYVLAQLSLSIISGSPHLFQFNNATGVLSNPVFLSPDFVDGEFSPNGRYLYGILSGLPPNAASINQYDLLSANIPTSAVSIANSSNLLTTTQTGPDGKIYILAWDITADAMILNRINCPNTSTPTYETSVFIFPNTLFFSLPNFPAWIFENDNNQFVSLGPDTLLLCNSPNPLILDAKNPGATFLWSTGATTQTITVTSPGTYSVTVTGPCGIGVDSVVVNECFSSSACDLFLGNNTTTVCQGDTIQLQANISGFSQINNILWTGGSGTFIPSNTVASPLYIPSASEITQGGLSLNLQVDAIQIDTTSPGSLIAYDHSGNDLLFAISTIDGSIDSLQDNFGFDWTAMGYKNSANSLYGNSVFSSFSNLNILNGDTNNINNFPNVKFFAGEFDNVHGKYYVIGNNTSPSGSSVDQFLATIDTATGALNIIGNLNLFTTDFFYYGIDDGINGLAYNPVLDVLYGVTHNGKLYSIDVNTAVPTFVGNTVPDLRGLAYDPSAAKLWGISTSATLYQINQNTGALINTVNCQVSFSFVTSLTYAGNDLPVQCSDSLQIQILPNISSTTSANACTSYVWNGNTYTTSGNYSAFFPNSSTQGCDSTATLNLNITGFPSVNASSVSGTCGQANGTATATATGGAGNYAYSWSNGATGNFINGLSSGSYSVVATDQNGCSSISQVIVTATPAAGVTLTVSDTILGLNETALLEILGGDTYSWTPSTGLSCDDCFSVIASPQSSTTYTVTGTDSLGCPYLRVVNVVIDIVCNELFVPDIFSPNGIGNPANEKLCVYSNCIKSMNFGIYNRWGELIFSTDNQNDCWDGTHKGVPVMTGVYAYRLFVEQFDGQKIEKSGNITITR
jgi:gliding motility-associated-like protein